MLASFIFHNKFVTVVLGEDIPDMKYQLHHLHSEEYFFQQKKETIANISISIYVLTLHLLYIIVVTVTIVKI